MGNFLDIRTRALRRLIDAPSAVTTEVPQLVNEGIRSLQTMHNFKVMETGLYAQVTTAGVREQFTLPSDFKEWRGKPFYRTDLGTQRELTWASDIVAPNMAFNNTDEGQPEVLVDGEQDSTGAGQILLWPLADGLSDYDDGEYRIYMPYVKFLPALVNDSDTNWLTVNAEEYLVNWAVGQGFMIDWDEQRSSLWQAQMLQKRKEIIQRDKLYRLSGVNTWVPHPQGARTPNLRQ